VDVRIIVSLKCVEIQYGTVLYCISCISVDRYDLVEVTAADEEDKHSVIVRCSQATARTGGLQVS